MIARSSHISLIFLFFFLSFAGCSDQLEERNWLATIPAESPIITLHHDAHFTGVLEDRDGLLPQELSDIEIDRIIQMRDRLPSSIPIIATAFYPTGSHELQPIFVLQDPGSGLEHIASRLQKDYAENHYSFKGHRIHILHLDNYQLYATQLSEWILISRNSAAIENGILTYTGDHQEINLSEAQLQDGDFIVNTPAIEKWLGLLAAPRYLPRFDRILDGTGATVITTSREDYDSELYNGSLSGNIPLNEGNLSPFVRAISAEPATSDLDRYIPRDAAFFTMYQNDPDPEAPLELEPTGPLDSLFLNDPELLQRFAATMDTPAAYATFEPSGFLSAGESLILRRLEEGTTFIRLLENLEQEGLIEVNDGIYNIRSRLLSRLIAGPLGHFSDFYISRSAGVAVLTQRPGLARRVDQDRRRRAVYFFDDDYMEARQQHPEAFSVWSYTRVPSLMNYLEPMLNPLNHASYLASLSNIITLSLTRNEDELSLKMDSYFSEERTEPVRDLWVYNLRDARITGKPTLANILGGGQDELIIATDDNNIHGVASDGTGFLDANTGTDQPVGSPVAYDWYGNNQYAILIAAGNKIYAWNARGIPLPNFPVNMDEQITTSLVLADVSMNGRPEMIVTTADRKVHVLDQRGRNIGGWPQDVNVQVTEPPSFESFNGENSVWVTAGNGLFAFSPQGNRRDPFPVFIESDLGPITFHEDHILAGAADGHLYAIGNTTLFADSLAIAMNENDTPEQENNGLRIQRIYVDDSPILNKPIIESLTVSESSGQNITEPMIGLQTLNGNLFLINEAGQLRLTRNMGQQSAEYDNMMITDVNGDGNLEIAAISNSGRLYAWETRTGQRLDNIPSASMRHPIITNLVANNNRELISQTRDGLRCWSFRSP